jgi:hypothetical protein
MYITYNDYNQLYDPIEGRVFNLLAFDACRMMDIHTTGIDNVKKLQKYFPTDEYSARAVRHCAAKVVNFLNQIRDAEMAAAAGRGYTETEQGLQRRIISRIEAGNEAISYSEAKTDATYIDAAVADKSVRDKLVAEIIWENLSGVEDANGVNLLFMGQYPRRY